jgi:hypothetical protein
LLKVAGRPSEANTKKPSERITKAERLRTLARGYKALEQLQRNTSDLERCMGEWVRSPGKATARTNTDATPA